MPVLTKINTNVIADDAVTSAKIPADAVIASDIAAGAVGISELATVIGITADYHKVPTFANDAARNTAIPSPVVGMLVYNTASGAVQQYNGTWSTIAPAPNITSVSGFLNNDTDSTISIFGSNFTSSSSVKMFTASAGGTQIGSDATTTFVSNIKLTAVFGAGSIGASGSTAYIEVDNAGASNRLATAITVNADPTVTHAGATGTSANTTNHLGTYGSAGLTGGHEDASTVLLLNFDRADGSTDFEDSSNTGLAGYNIVASGGAHIETDQYKFGTAHGKVNNSSGQFDGTDDKLNIANDNLANFGTGNWTIDYWIKSTDTSANRVFSKGTHSGGQIFIRAASDSSEWIKIYKSGSEVVMNTSGTEYITTDGNWHHVAIVRDQSNVKAYIDGTLRATDSTLTSGAIEVSSAGANVGIGSGINDGSSEYFEGYLDSFRISLTNRWSSNFTPPTGPYGISIGQTIPTITLTGAATQLAADEDIEFTSVDNTAKADGSRSLTDTDVGLVLANLTGGDKNKATLTGTITSATSTTHTNMPLKLQVRKTLSENTYNNSTTVTFTGSTTTAGLAPAMPVSGTGIPASTTISTVDSATVITLSAATTGGAQTNEDLVFLDLTRVSHQYNGSDTLDNTDAMYTIATGASSVPVLFNARRYVGNTDAGDNNVTRSLTGMGIQSDLVWIKRRSGASTHMMYDSLRGVTKVLHSDSGGAEQTENANHGLLSFNSDGFTLGDDTDVSGQVNRTNETFVGWGWKAGGAPSGELVGSGATMSGTSGAGTIDNSATGVLRATSLTQSVNQTTGFSITTYTGGATAVNQDTTFPHNLGAAPAFILVKSVSNAEGWVAYHISNSTDKVFEFNENAAEYTEPNGRIEVPSSTLININAADNASAFGVKTSRNAYTYVCYAWKAVAGVSAFGTYEGTGGVNTITWPNSNSFTAGWVMIKNMDNTGSWIIYDKFREGSRARWLGRIYADLDSAASDNGEAGITMTSTGFTMTSGTIWSGVNTNNSTYIYAAFA